MENYCTRLSSIFKILCFQKWNYAVTIIFCSTDNLSILEGLERLKSGLPLNAEKIEMKPHMILSKFVEDALWLTSRGKAPEGSRLTGKEEIRKMLHKRFTSIPDMSWKIHDHWVSGDRGCSEWTVTGNELNLLLLW